MKILLSLLSLMYLGSSCNVPPKEEPTPKLKNIYFSLQEEAWKNKLAEWNVVRYNDSAKWRVYCYYGDDSCTRGTENRQLDPTPLGYLDLKLVFGAYRNDTLDLLYSFIYDDSTEVRYTTNRSKDIFDRFQSAFGVSFDTKTSTVLGYIAGNGTFWELGPLIRYENFNHPSLLQFLNQNSSFLEPWFRNEAIRRGLFKIH